MVFHLGEHPLHKSYFQCVTFNHFSNEAEELAYNLFVFLAMFGLPLIVIVATYSAIIVEISTKSRECDVASPRRKTCNGDVRLRRSGTVTLHRARTKILRLTFIVVAVFILCWTPYNVMCVMFWVDRTTARTVPFPVQRALFLFAASNSCMNPIVYGIFMINCTSLMRVARPTVLGVQRSQYLGTTTSTAASELSCNQISKRKTSVNPMMRKLNQTTKDWTRTNTISTTSHIVPV